MFEETNQTEGLEGTEGTNDGALEASNALEGASASADKIKVKYNGEEKEISLEEAVTYAQKGMNYDHVAQELEQKRQQASVLEAYAKANGMKTDEYVEFLRQNQSEYERQQLAQTYSSKFEDLPEDVVNELVSAKQAERELARYRQREAETAQSEAAKVRAWETLMKAYPDVKVDKLPPEVYSLVEAGLTPTEAYQKHLIASLQLTKKQDEHNQQTKNKALGSIAGAGGGDLEADPFLKGFSGV